MDYMPGGDLRYHLGQVGRFTESQVKFFTACILTGLEYLHVNNVVHRDIKPENLVLDSRGYLRLTDFGIARVHKDGKSNAQDTSGTPGYMAPEVMCRLEHGIAVDYFGLGVMLYEFMTGARPYRGRTRQEIRDAILARQVFLRRRDIPDDWSLEAADFINKLLQRKPINRLGNNGPAEVRHHSWLSDVDWPKIYEKTFPAPYVPTPNAENFNKAHVMCRGKCDESVPNSGILLQQ
jgi:serine/threonine protein kinase